MREDKQLPFRLHFDKEDTDYMRPPPPLIYFSVIKAIGKQDGVPAACTM